MTQKLITIFCIFFSITIHAQISIIDYGTDGLSIEGGTPYEINLDSDADIEMTFSNWGFFQIDFYQPNGGSGIFNQDFGMSTLRILNEGEEIGTNQTNWITDQSGWTSCHYGGFWYPNPNDYLGQTVYLGFRIEETGGDFKYGWVQVFMQDEYNIFVNKIGLQNSLNTSILAGEGNNTSQVPVTSITVQGAGGANSINMIGETLQMEAIVLPVDATNNSVTWSVDNTNIADISANGLLTPLEDGVIIVTATSNDGSNISGDLTITITNQSSVPVTSITVQGAGGANSINMMGETLQMEAMVLPVDATNNSVTWSVDNTNIADISANGLLTPLEDGVIVVTATSNDGSNISGDLTVTITNQSSSLAKDLTERQNQFSCFPNPTLSTLHLKWNNTISPDNNKTIVIVDNFGNQVIILNVGDIKSNIINVEILPKGLYFIQIWDQNTLEQTSKFVKL